jgi:hypothetical protein
MLASSNVVWLVLSKCSSLGREVSDRVNPSSLFFSRHILLENTILELTVAQLNEVPSICPGYVEIGKLPL